MKADEEAFHLYRYNSMKIGNLLFLICISTIPSMVNGQQCEFDLREKDKFSGKTRVSYIFTFQKDVLYLRKLDDEVTIEVEASYNGALEKGVAEGSVAQIRLSNGEFISIVARGNIDPVVKVNEIGTKVSATFNVPYNISSADLLRLSQFEPTLIKVQLGIKHIEKRISARKGERIRAGAKCIMNYKGD